MVQIKGFNEIHSCCNPGHELIKCKDCVYFSPKQNTSYVKYKRKGHWGGLFKSKWIKENDINKVITTITIPPKCKLYPKHMNTDPEHECGKGFIREDYYE